MRPIGVPTLALAIVPRALREAVARIRAHHALWMACALIPCAGWSQTPCPPPLNAGPAEMQRLAHTTQPDRGFLWEVTRDGRRSYLYGTVHVARLAWDFPGPVVRKALLDSRVLAVELDPTDPHLLARLTAAQGVAAPSNEAADPARSAAIEAGFAREFTRACVDAARLQYMAANMKLAALTALSARDRGLYPQTSIDTALVGFMRATGKRVLELETPEEQGRALEQSDGGGSASVERALARLDSGETRRELLKLTHTWAVSDATALHAYTSSPGYLSDRAARAAVFADRDRLLAQRIDDTFQKEDGVFAAIGMLHTTNDGNVVERLQHMGYTVRALVPAVEVPAEVQETAPPQEDPQAAR